MHKSEHNVAITAPLKFYSPQEISQQSEQVERLYAARKKIHPRLIAGWFSNWRVVFVILTQIIYFGAPWLTWNDRQAVLFDVASRKFYLFDLVFWPHDFIYLAVLLIISALALFLFTAAAGRLWCGYACPQTVYTEIFVWIEQWVEGNRLQRIKLDQSPLTAHKVTRRAIKHFIWGIFSLITGFTFVGYFTPIDALAADTLSLSLGGWPTFWMFFYGFATYGNAGWLREQVCKYMCPYARFQCVMFDPDTLVVTYDAARGEPRGGRSKSADPAQLNLGSCIDCHICKHVCPVDIDIRDGLQYECIGCGACIDACDSVMDQMGYERGLIRYASENAVANKLSRTTMWSRMLRPRILGYTFILCFLVFAISYSLQQRASFKVDILRDRQALARELEDGYLENVYRLQVINIEEQPRRFSVEVQDLKDARIAAEIEMPFEVAATGNRQVVVRVAAPADSLSRRSTPIELQVRADDDAEAVSEPTVFLKPIN